jgi:cobalt-zinc-cadmium efflux system protein
LLSRDCRESADRLWLHKGSKDNLNIRGAYLHMLGDAVSAFGVVIAGILVATMRAPLADPVVSLLIAGLILYSSFGVLRESATVLLEGTPSGMDMPAVIAAIKGVTGVLDVHDLHVWMVGPGVVACSCHILVAEQSIREGQQVLRARAQRHRASLPHHTHDRPDRGGRLRGRRHVLHGAPRARRISSIGLTRLRGVLLPFRSWMIDG